ncbi:MAG: hypothetical protein D4S01_05110 [Dehalococcoidia bacterium]|nr:MAG: hypothetical protein D4S01_05110 [Dehalococcoidia bacterium]
MPKKKTQIERKVTITYRWWSEKGVKPEHIEALEEAAMEVIMKQVSTEGYTSGELNDNINMSEENTEDGVEYSGWWEMTTTNTDEE